MGKAKSSKKQTVKSCTRTRCVNIDWLEVHAREPVGKPHNAEYYRQCGCEVEEREYGTRVYREMFVIMGSDGLPAIEVRRNPASSGLNGIHDPEETHIRIVNRLCYYDDTAEKFEKFLENHHYTDIRISRIDICLDFVSFDFGDDPARFLRRYLEHKYAKINQGNICAHGKDAWEGQNFNSVKWGSPSSNVSTKMYNKTMELKDQSGTVFAKPYIRQAWMLCGFIDDMQHVTKNGKEVQVWRVEFTIKSPKHNWVAIELNGKARSKYSLRNTLEVYRGREQLLTMFASLSRHYFRFKKYKEGVRKDRCEDKKLFDFSGQQQVYKLAKDLEICGNGDKSVKRYQRLLKMLEEFDMSHFNEEQKQAVATIKQAIMDDTINSDLKNPYDLQLRTIARALMVRAMIQKNMPSFMIESELREAFKVGENILQYFTG